MEEPEVVSQSRKTLRRVNTISMSIIFGSMVPFAAILLAVGQMANGYFEPVLLGSLVLYLVPVIAAAAWSHRETRESQSIITAWTEVQKRQIMDRLEVESAPATQLHPLVGQISTRAPELAAQARTLGRQLDSIEREHATLTETLPELPEGPTKDEVSDTLTRLDSERAAALEALVRLHRSALEGHHHDEALSGLVSEVPLRSEPASEQVRTSAARQASVER